MVPKYYKKSNSLSWELETSKLETVKQWSQKLVQYTYDLSTVWNEFYYQFTSKIDDRLGSCYLARPNNVTPLPWFIIGKIISLVNLY